MFGCVKKRACLYVRLCTYMCVRECHVGRGGAKAYITLSTRRRESTDTLHTKGHTNPLRNITWKYGYIQARQLAHGL